MGIDDDTLLKSRYDEIAKTLDDRTTACDFNLRDLEIDLGLEAIRDGDAVLDVGCGLGVALRRYATERSIEAHGIDYSANMVEGARRRLRETQPDLSIEFREASVLDLPYEGNRFDVVTSHRCLMALLEWGRQQEALLELHRVLKAGAILVLLEGTFDGLERLNFFRRMFGLPEIEAGGRDRLLTLKFHERQLLTFVDPYFEVVRTQRFGMYYFLTRIVQPLLVAPEAPTYDHPLNEVAKRLARRLPDFEHMGQLVGFVLRKRP
ncbi:MAG: class I SAM-dependent methyltransferase [Gaiellaceae bacterium]|jgi:ubiquinone/menaquinone biosynthesis C-methylase UbiE